ncbi:DUF2804 domain-containing protein [Chitinimonas lacunae]|uniref:DUF2804 domain-containing protein n=1 Tax=Chitinimonas lacunae TaxID=1963018 RepID=A0ABV8MRK0_9NEIS
MSVLEAAPSAVVDTDGRPFAGRFAGRCSLIDWSRLAPPLARSAWWRRFHHKRWHYVGIAAADCYLGIAVVDVGWTNTCFAYLFDRRQGSVIGGVSRDGLPGLSARVDPEPRLGAMADFSWLGARIRLEEFAAERYRVRVEAPRGFQVEAELDGRTAAPWLFAAGPVAGGVWHSTHKSPALAVSGEARAGGQHYRLDGAHASIDHSNGLLPRLTTWKWASAHTAELGFNLQSGYFGDHENVLWLDGQPIALGRARFEFDPQQPLAPWHIHTEDGLLDLRFTPEGARRENRNLLVAASRYIQPVGTFEGTVRAAPDAPPRQVSRLLGVTEDHLSRW